MLSVFGRPSKVAKQGATSKLPVFSFRKLVGDADVNIFGSVSTASRSSVVDLHSIHGDWLAIVDGEPGRVLLLGRAHVRVSGVLSLPVDAVGGSEDTVGGGQAGRQGGQLSST